MTAVDQQTRRRITLTGLTALDGAQACPGYVLYAPLQGPGMVYLINLKGEVVHLYNFFSSFISGAQRLPNGNTLITEGAFGRMFQVTPAKEVVWEYINPHFHPGTDGTLSNLVFRTTHYQKHEIPILRG